jgi:hypothetical protein
MQMNIKPLRGHGDHAPNIGVRIGLEGGST